MRGVRWSHTIQNPRGHRRTRASRRHHTCHHHLHSKRILHRPLNLRHQAQIRKQPPPSFPRHNRRGITHHPLQKPGALSKLFIVRIRFAEVGLRGSSSHGARAPASPTGDTPGYRASKHQRWGGLHASKVVARISFVVTSIRRDQGGFLYVHLFFFCGGRLGTFFCRTELVWPWRGFYTLRVDATGFDGRIGGEGMGCACERCPEGGGTGGAPGRTAVGGISGVVCMAHVKMGGGDVGGSRLGTAELGEWGGVIIRGVEGSREGRWFWKREGQEVRGAASDVLDGDWR